MRGGGTRGLSGSGGPTGSRGSSKDDTGLLGLDRVVSELVVLLFLGSGGVSVEGGKKYL